MFLIFANMTNFYGSFDRRESRRKENREERKHDLRSIFLCLIGKKMGGKWKDKLTFRNKNLKFSFLLFSFQFKF